MTIEVGQTLDRRWIVRRLLARADHASLYEVHHAFLDRVASIVIAPPEERERLLNEAMARDRTYHPGILGILDVADTREGVPYLVSAPFAGRSPDGVLRSRDRLTADEAVGITLALGEALCHLHALDMAHLALSPGSVLVDGRGAMLLDLGRFPTPLGALSGALASMPYTAPERLTASAPASRQTDVYSVAAMLAEMLSGELPEEWPPDQGSFPAPLAEVVDRGLDEPSRRFESMEAFMAAIQRATETVPMESLPPTRQRRIKGCLTSR